MGRKLLLLSNTINISMMLQHYENNLIVTCWSYSLQPKKNIKAYALIQRIILLILVHCSLTKKVRMFKCFSRLKSFSVTCIIIYVYCSDTQIFMWWIISLYWIGLNRIFVSTLCIFSHVNDIHLVCLWHF